MQLSKPTTFILGFLGGMTVTVLISVVATRQGYLASLLGPTPHITVPDISEIVGPPGPVACVSALDCGSDWAGCLDYFCDGGFCKSVTRCTKDQVCNGEGTCIGLRLGSCGYHELPNRPGTFRCGGDCEQGEECRITIVENPDGTVEDQCGCVPE